MHLAIPKKHGFSAHAYADDLQLYDHGDTSDCAELVMRMSACIEKLKDWLASSRLRLNTSKTELIWLGAAC